MRPTVPSLSAAWCIRRFIVRGEHTPFVMELPPYRLPTTRAVAGRMAEFKYYGGKAIRLAEPRVWTVLACDAKGKVVAARRAAAAFALGGRVLDDRTPKYLNSPETRLFKKSETIFGIHRAKGPLRTSGLGLVVEGYMDVIPLHAQGFENAVADMTVGESCTVTLNPDQAYGVANPDMVQDVPRKLMPDDLELKTGMVLQGQASDGRVDNFTVVSFTEETVKLDANHPLAGQALTFDGTDDYVQLAEPLGDSNDFTFTGWVFWNGGGNWQPFTVGMPRAMVNDLKILAAHGLIRAATHGNGAPAAAAHPGFSGTRCLAAGACRLPAPAP